MMKIHTTQNLSSSADLRSTNISMPKQIRYTKYSDASIPLCTQPESDTFESTSFKGKKSVLNKAAKAGKKKFKERVANSGVTKKILGSDSFGKTLDWTASQEVLVQSGSALGVCCILRPGTLALFPGDKNNKQDFLYAAGHSISSGVWGLVVPLVFIKPPTSGVNQVFKEMNKYINDDMLKKMYPHLNIDSIYTLKDGQRVRRPLEEWLDIEGRKFSADTKNVRKIFVPVHVADVSEETLKERLKGLNVDSIKDSSGKRVSANNWTISDGGKANFNLKDIFICVQEEGKETPVYYPLEFVNEKVLKELYTDLDINSIKGKDGLRLHPNEWKKNDGTSWAMDLDQVFLSDVKESADTTPLVAGFTRPDKNGELKEISFQDNARNEHDLGTPVTQEMLDADKVNIIKKKIGGWLPDIIVTYPRAAATIALLPFILKHVFGLEKSKKPEPTAEQKTEINNENENENKAQEIVMTPANAASVKKEVA